MIKIEYEVDKESQYKKAKMKLKHEHTNVVEILMLINELIKLIQTQDKNFKLETIFEILHELNTNAIKKTGVLEDKKEKRKNKNGKSSNNK
jgi:hypothetical protein